MPAEELLLDPDGLHWNQMGPQPKQMDIAWPAVEQISFDPLDNFIFYDGNRKMKFPRIVLENQDEIMEFIEQNLGLKKTTQGKRWRDEDYTAVLFTR